MLTDTINTYRMRLLRLLKELETSGASGQGEEAIVQLEQQSVGRLNRMDALQRQQMAKEAARRRKLEHAKIKAALKRIEEGEFGFCADCGEAISPRRLEANMTTHLCFDCAK